MEKEAYHPFDDSGGHRDWYPRAELKGINPSGVEWGIQPLRGWFIFHPTVGYRLRLFTFIPAGDEIPLRDPDLWVKIIPTGEGISCFYCNGILNGRIRMNSAHSRLSLTLALSQRERGYGLIWVELVNPSAPEGSHDAPVRVDFREMPY